MRLCLSRASLQGDGAQPRQQQPKCGAVGTAKCPLLVSLASLAWEQDTVAGLPPRPRDGFGYPTLEPSLLKPLPPGHPAPKSPSWPCLRAGGVRREQAVASTQGASSGVGTAAACPFSPDTSVASPLTACCPGFSPFTAVFVLPLPLSLSSSSSLFLSLFQEGSHSVSLHAFLLPLLVLLLPLPPLLGTSSSQPRLHPLSLLCLPPCPPPVLPEGGGGWSCPLCGQRGALESHTWS